MQCQCAVRQRGCDDAHIACVSFCRPVSHAFPPLPPPFPPHLPLQRSLLSSRSLLPPRLFPLSLLSSGHGSFLRSLKPRSRCRCCGGCPAPRVCRRRAQGCTQGSRPWRRRGAFNPQRRPRACRGEGRSADAEEARRGQGRWWWGGELKCGWEHRGRAQKG
jgi:hypothetical protein